jgi:hypothetical protein
MVSECSDHPLPNAYACFVHTAVRSTGGESPLDVMHVREEAGDRCNSVKQQTANPLPNSSLIPSENSVFYSSSHVEIGMCQFE